MALQVTAKSGGSEAAITAPRPSLAEPLRVPVFRRIWGASLFSNFGLMIQGVGAAWAMVLLGAPADTVALVQTAIMMPVMLIAMAAGAVADTFDRRKVGIVALSFALLGASCLSLSAYSGILSPPLILLFCFLIGSGHALFGPAWQASIAEQVPNESLPQAVSLNAISYNIARSFGPAVGGVIVSAAGVFAAFTTNALLYIPILIVLLTWRRRPQRAHIPPEHVGRAILTGTRFIRHSPAIRVALCRVLAIGLAGGSISSLMPMVASQLLHGGAQTYGLLLGALGIGSVIGAIAVGQVTRHLGIEGGATFCAIVLSACLMVVASSAYVALTLAALVAGGVAWTLSITLFNIYIQIAAPRWVAGRALAAYQAALAGGIAIGSWLWGIVAETLSVPVAIALSASAMAATAILRLFLRLPTVSATDNDRVALDALDLARNPSGRTGPVVVETEYRVDPAEARLFYTVMQEVRQSRHRNGAYDWSIARDMADPWVWSERFYCSTWNDYLRLRDRATRAEIGIMSSALAFHRGEHAPKINRRLEWPFGSKPPKPA